MGNGNTFGGMFQDDLRMINMEARMRLPEANIIRANRDFVDRGNNTGSRLGLGTREERSAKRRELLDVNGRPIERLTSTGRMFRDSLNLR